MFFSALAEPVAKPAPAPGFSPAFRLATTDYALKLRAYGDGTSACWSHNAMCDQWSDLDSDCDIYDIASDDWDKCFCETGVMAAHEA
jgi:hypothetical protein